MSYFCPNDLSEALDVLSRGPGKIVAGGTDVYPSARKGHLPDYYLDVTRIDALSSIRTGDDGTFIGAAVTWSEIIAADLPAAFDGLKAAGREVGSVQIQNAGTVAGNICNASPAADGVPPLLALDASIEVSSAARGRRLMPLSEFIKGVRSTDLAKDEMVVGIKIPPQSLGMRSAFEKLGSRKYLVISISMTAANIDLASDGRIREARVAVGACSAVAQRLVALEATLIGQRPQDVEVEVEHLAGLSPIDDVRGSGRYRLDVVQEQCRRAILKAAST